MKGGQKSLGILSSGFLRRKPKRLGNTGGTAAVYKSAFAMDIISGKKKGMGKSIRRFRSWTRGRRGSDNLKKKRLRRPSNVPSFHGKKEIREEKTGSSLRGEMHPPRGRDD